MTLVKVNRQFRDHFFPGTHAPFYGNLFSELLDRSVGQVLGNNPIPPVNILENDQNYEIHLALPGHKKEDFNIDLEHDLLTISLEEKENEKEETRKFTRQEFRFQSFKRSFTLPDKADLNSIHAEYQDGILFIKINKKEEEKPETKKIEIH